MDAGGNSGWIETTDAAPIERGLARWRAPPLPPGRAPPNARASQRIGLLHAEGLFLIRLAVGSRPASRLRRGSKDMKSMSAIPVDMQD
jgi:hypothetical protein